MTQYREKTDSELERLAESVIQRFPNRSNGFILDVEGVIEDMGLDLLPRPGIRKILSINAYLPRNENKILIDADYGSALSYFRPVMAEEISHRIIEPELWANGVAAPGADLYKLDAHLYDTIEGEANRMALALLMPKAPFVQQYQLHFGRAKSQNCPQPEIATIEKLSDDFEVTFHAAQSRALKLGLIPKPLVKHILPGAVVF